MALNSNIILSGEQLDVLGPIQQGLRSREQFDQAPFRNQLLEQGVQQGQQRVDINEQTIRKQALEQQLFGARKAISAHDEQGEFGGPNAAGVIDGIREGFKGDEDRVKAEILEYQQDPFAYISNAKNEVDAYDSQIGRNQQKTGLASAKTEIFDNGTVVNALPDGTTQVSNPAGEIVTGDEREKVLKTARTEQISFAGQKAAATAGGKAEGEASKSTVVAKAKSEIARAVKLATADATAKGETLTDLNRANASLPGLRDVVTQLKELAPLATSTILGKTYDFAVKESGFGSTKGANSRAKFIGVINNQILPLLKQTFGAAFTKAEGDELKRTMGDPDSSPEEKIVQLDAFIEGKAREIQAKERELGQELTPSATLLDSSKKARLDELRAKAGFK